MKNMKAQELLNKAIKIESRDYIPPFRGIYIIQQRKLHDSGYRLMYVIGHTDYDDKLKDYKYYLISCCSDVIDFGTVLSSLNDIYNLHLDIDKNGLIHIWSNKELYCGHWINLSTCELKIY